MKTEGNENQARDGSPFVFPSRILGLEITGGTHGVLLHEGFDVLLPASCYTRWHLTVDSVV